MYQGDLGEIKVAAHFMQLGYQVFTCLGKGFFDLIITKDGINLERVEVKSTSRRSRNDTGFEVQLKRVRPNRTKSTIHKWDSTKCDKLAIYVVPIDKIVVFDSEDVKVSNSMILGDKEIEKRQHGN